MKFPKTKKEITLAILKEIPDGYLPTTSLDDTIFKMWLTGRGGQGLRLSEDGLQLFELAKLEFYDFALGLDPKTMHSNDDYFTRELKRIFGF